MTTQRTVQDGEAWLPLLFGMAHNDDNSDFLTKDNC